MIIRGEKTEILNGEIVYIRPRPRGLSGGTVIYGGWKGAELPKYHYEVLSHLAAGMVGAALALLGVLALGL